MAIECVELTLNQIFSGVILEPPSTIYFNEPALLEVNTDVLARDKPEGTSEPRYRRNYHLGGQPL